MAHIWLSLSSVNHWVAGAIPRVYRPFPRLWSCAGPVIAACCGYQL